MGMGSESINSLPGWLGCCYGWSEIGVETLPVLLDN